jgi:hypothetical protein
MPITPSSAATSLLCSLMRRYNITPHDCARVL